MMLIPTAIPLLGHRITVEVIHEKQWPHDKDTVGIWDPSSHKIQVLAEYDGTKLEQTYLHELVHAILDLMTHKLARNEQFVDTFSGLLHQAITGAEYPPKGRKKRP